MSPEEAREALLSMTDRQIAVMGCQMLMHAAGWTVIWDGDPLLERPPSDPEQLACDWAERMAIAAWLFR